MPVSSVSILHYMVRLVFCGALFFLFLYWKMLPTVLINPGMAAYQPPPGTRLEPLPRKMDAPELAELPDRTPAIVVDEGKPEIKKLENGEARVAVRKRPRPPPQREYQTPASSSYAQQWNRGYEARRQASSWF